MHRQIERLRPRQITAARAEGTHIYRPRGTIEWHFHALPFGLAGLSAHGICLRATDRTGGRVWPVLYAGTRGDHGEFPWTVMMSGRAEIGGLMQTTLGRFADLGLAEVDILSGHFADEQLDLIDRLAGNWNARGTGPRALTLAMNRFDVSGIPPDHAGQFKTTSLSGHAPDLVDRGMLSDAADARDWMDPRSPLWGIIGANPRATPPPSAAGIVAHIVAAVCAEVGPRTADAA